MVIIEDYDENEGVGPCCGPPPKKEEQVEKEPEPNQSTSTKQLIRERYTSIATGDHSSSQGDVDSAGLDEASTSMGYSKQDLGSIPEGSNLGLGSGVPVEVAELQSGETVVDLGSGAGIDCFLAANKVGKTGKVIGVDMTPAMIDKARANRLKGNYPNVEFRLGEIEHLPLADNSVDAIISNCVINLAPDKSQVFNDAYRVLKPGGRLVISDILLAHEFPPAVQHAISEIPGCVSQAVVSDKYLQMIREAGFVNAEIINQEVIQPQKRKIEGQKGEKSKRILMVSGHKIEVELSTEEDAKLLESILRAHVRAYKP